MELTAGVVRRPRRLELVVGRALSLWSDPPIFGSPTAVGRGVPGICISLWKSEYNACTYSNEDSFEVRAQLPQGVAPKIHTRCSIEKFYGT